MPRIAPCLIVAALSAALPPARAEEFPSLALKDVRERVAAAHPRLAAAEASAAAAAARARSAGRPADPELEVEAESFGGSGAVSGFDAAETSLRLTQPFAPPGARSAAAEGARREAEAALAASEAVRREARRSTDAAFHALAARQDMLALAGTRLDRARRLHQIALDRTSSGAASPLDALRAEADAGLAEAALVRASGERERAAVALASLWGGTGDVRVASSAAAPLPGPPALDALRAAVVRHPVLARAAAEQARAAAAQRAARAARFGEYGLMGGVQRFEETGDTGFTAGLSVVLPLWSRPAAAAGAAGRDLDAARHAAAAEAREADVAIAAAHSAYTRAREVVLVLEGRSLPPARRMSEGMMEGYRAGKFGLIAAIEAQAAAADIEAQAIEAREEALRALAELEYWSPVGEEPTDLH
jgi:cobalt-zinc-cadmium efflux system outer membrane protein